MATDAPSQPPAAAAAPVPAEPEKPLVYEHLLRDEGSELHTAFDRLMRPLLIGVVGAACKTVMSVFNNTETHGIDKFMEAVHNRPAGVPLITVSNHITALDDPLVPGLLLPFQTIIDSKAVRWTLCATDRCFKNRFMTEFFKYTKVLPVKRGAGLDQAGMGVALDKLNRGDWLHVFPEGTRSRDGQMGPIRLGIGRLVTAPVVPPIVLPFFMTGIDDVLPVGARMFGTGNDVQILFGDPIETADILRRHPVPGREAFREIAGRVADSLRGLRDGLERMRLDELRAALAAYRANEGTLCAVRQLGAVDADGALFGAEPAPIDAALFVPIRPRTLAALLRDASAVEASLVAPAPAPARLPLPEAGPQEPVDSAPEPRARARLLAELRQRMRDGAPPSLVHLAQRARDARERVRIRLREIRARATDPEHPFFSTPVKDLLARARSEFSVKVSMLAPPPGGLSSTFRPPRSFPAGPAPPPPEQAALPPLVLPPPSSASASSSQPSTPVAARVPLRPVSTPTAVQAARSAPPTPRSPADALRGRRESPPLGHRSPLYSSLFDPPRIGHVMRRLA
eukprot:tig00000057_g113.t1